MSWQLYEQENQEKAYWMLSAPMRQVEYWTIADLGFRSEKGEKLGGGNGSCSHN